uniref:Scinderin like b n=1 Tax=Scleropages formosus TaxID=113540 RepID=A0A8C9VDH7_SCLFO
MVVHKEFQNAGKTPGLEIWRIESMDLKPVPKQHYGSFYEGDAYVVMHTTRAPSHSIHMWHGKQCSQDESGAAAIFVTQLDDHLGGGPVQFCEQQGNESITFLSYFKSGIKYMKGGVASGFKHVVTNEANVKRLLHVKGRRVIRATEVPLSWSSFNRGDCFIVDLGKDVYQWCGSECSHFERLKASQVAIDIRDNERGGRAKLNIVEDGSEPDALLQVNGCGGHVPLGAVGLPALSSRRCFLSASATSWTTGSMERSLCGKVLSFGCSLISTLWCKTLRSGIIVMVFEWNTLFLILGPDSNMAERKAAMSAAQNFIKEKNYPKSTQVNLQHPACAALKPYVIGRIAKIEQVPFDASTLHSNSAMAAQHGMVDDGSGKVQIWRVEGGDKVAVDPATYGQFFGGDCYLILYTYKQGGKEQHIIYTWQGLKCTQDELAASAFLTVKLDDSMGGAPVQVRVTQGQEPAHLMSLFKGKPMIIHQGGTSRKGGQTQTGSTRLLHIRQSSSRATRAVKPCASSLNTNDVFVLKCPSTTYVWRGTGASSEEAAAAKHVVGVLGGSATDVAEGKEPEAFWSALGGKKQYQTSKSLQKTIKPPRLFGCSNKTGRLVAEEVPGDFTQSDLATDDVMLLDTDEQLYIWVGKDANDTEKAGAPKIAQEYLASDPRGGRSIPIVTIKQGSEPMTFTGWFLAWDTSLWDKDPLERIRANF